MEYVEKTLQESYSKEAWENLVFWNARLNIALNDQQKFLESKTRMGCLMEGDRNTAFYHTTIKVRCSHNFSQVTLPSGDLCNDRDTIGSLAVDFFTELPRSFSFVPESHYFNNIVHVVSGSDNASISDVPNDNEVCAAVLNISGRSALGPDGFIGTLCGA